MADFVRRLPVGAEVQPRGGTHFRVWAPRCERVRVQIARADGTPPARHQTMGEPLALRMEEQGCFSLFVADAEAGDRYWFLLDDNELKLPDPASRFQPEGPHGPSEIIDAGAYRWSDAGWKGVRLPGQVIYELHL